jgi:hypothetical protein
MDYHEDKEFEDYRIDVNIVSKGKGDIIECFFGGSFVRFC